MTIEFERLRATRHRVVMALLDHIDVSAPADVVTALLGQIDELNALVDGADVEDTRRVTRLQNLLDGHLVHIQALDLARHNRRKVKL